MSCRTYSEKDLKRLRAVMPAARRISGELVTRFPKAIRPDEVSHALAYVAIRVGKLAFADDDFSALGRAFTLYVGDYPENAEGELFQTAFVSLYLFHVLTGDVSRSRTDASLESPAVSRCSRSKTRGRGSSSTPTSRR